MPTFIGVDLGGTNVRAGRVEDATLTATHAQPISSRAPQEVVIDEVAHAIQQVLTPAVTAVGIGVPSLVDVDTGTVFAVENIPSWREVPLKKILQARFNIPTHINNDANCFTLGEHLFGAGREAQNMVGLIAGTGMACGVIANGKLFSGPNCGVGEIGCIPYNGKNLEYFCSGQFFARGFQTDGATLSANAAKGNSHALAAFSQFGVHFAHAIMTILYAYDPQLIILGGSVSKSFPHFESTMWQTIRQHFTYPHILPRFKILPASVENVAILGAASLCNS